MIKKLFSDVLGHEKSDSEAKLSGYFFKAVYVDQKKYGSRCVIGNIVHNEK